MARSCSIRGRRPGTQRSRRESRQTAPCTPTSSGSSPRARAAEGRGATSHAGPLARPPAVTRAVFLYEDPGNTTCHLEPYDIPGDEIGGGPYTANSAGHGHTEGVVDADLGEVLSVSVRRASDCK